MRVGAAVDRFLILIRICFGLTSTRTEVLNHVCRKVARGTLIHSHMNTAPCTSNGHQGHEAVCDTKRCTSVPVSTGNLPRVIVGRSPPTHGDGLRIRAVGKKMRYHVVKSPLAERFLQQGRFSDFRSFYSTFQRLIWRSSRARNRISVGMSQLKGSTWAEPKRLNLLMCSVLNSRVRHTGRYSSA
ncbi:hypothetical protein RvY_12160 [Ramazzottius varieornatus]|uniref:Secreted protein n=1 Tax=Ramazzottius varieornatus TaxID=947166 RepID=A0A1D1VIM8_RAMVA|nr:hypothetical protein RvY_12160 [Ramazzottius varieornatus]